MKLPLLPVRLGRPKLPRRTLWAGVTALVLLVMCIAVSLEESGTRLSAFLLYLETGRPIHEVTEPVHTEPSRQEPPAVDVTGATEPATEPSIEPTAGLEEPVLTISTYDATLSYMGEGFRLDTGSIPAQDVQWWSEDGTVATVFGGYVTGVGPGTTYIFAQYGQQARVCVVRCRWDTLALEESSITLTSPGATTKLSLDRTNLPGNVSLADLSWSSDDLSVATVRDGVVTAVGVGSTVIRGEYGGETVLCTVRCRWGDAGQTVSPPLSDRPHYTAGEADAIKTTGAWCPDLESLLLGPLSWDLDSSEPAVLIYHTHATETFIDVTGSQDYRVQDTDRNMVCLGDYLASLLESRGIRVIHDRAIHDRDYTTAYAVSRKSVQAYLDQYPSIRLVLDLHRDAAAYGDGLQWKTTCTVRGQTSAQLMLYVSNAHGLWQQNLGIGAKLYAQLERESAGICRPMRISGLASYNQDLHAGALLVEVGFAGNTLEEARVAIGVLADAIGALKDGAN